MNPKIIKLQLEYSHNEEYQRLETLFTYQSKAQFEKKENLNAYTSLKKSIKICSADVSPFKLTLSVLLDDTFLNYDAINFNKDDVFCANFIKVSGDNNLSDVVKLFDAIGILFVLREKIWLNSNTVIYRVEPVFAKVNNPPWEFL